MSEATDGGHLLGDVGGTNIRLAWQANAASPIEHVRVFPCSEYAGIEQAIEDYLKIESLQVPRLCALGIANPVTGDDVRMTNHSWSFSQESLRHHFGFARLVVLNDFTALALALPKMPNELLVQVGGKSPVANETKALIGPGTGLGVSGLIYNEHESLWTPISGEGGHVSLAAQTDEEFGVLKLIRRRYGHVSAERVLSGPGMVDLYLALREYRSAGGKEISGAHEITELALVHQDPLAIQTLELFTSFLGSVAGDLALTLGARGGVYIGGGIMPRLLDWLPGSPLRGRFESKGRFKSYLQEIPIWVINSPTSPALEGAAQALHRA
jgi:glucokinase